MWWCQFIDWLKFETRPSCLLNFGTASLNLHAMRAYVYKLIFLAINQKIDDTGLPQGSLDECYLYSRQSDQRQVKTGILFNNGQFPGGQFQTVLVSDLCW